ncbi:hypothetical protein CMV30_17465 [Nibricoccus aquaticus]|uniref:Uncharacterized protein n=1 Tax=Nibricoccus aquaticus TaxID=2576891 RepID=A0A290QM17_9BACT|nr:hypothetical protein [Nibricoccus aquaticus]ATC65591.1 hypothetical protein CMV30_17465 [Nibricoccus aquaticus]
MNFEELKVVWDSETKEAQFTLNEAALHAVVRRRNEEIHRGAACCQLGDIIGGIGFGVVMVVFAVILAMGDPAWFASWKWIRVQVSGWHVAGLFLSGLIMWGYAVAMYGVRRRQLQREENSADSLRGDLDRAIAHTDFQIRVARSSVWWGLVPQWVATCLLGLVVFSLSELSAGYFSAILGVLGALLSVVITCQLRAINGRYAPRRRELELLRTKLADMQ